MTITINEETYMLQDVFRVATMINSEGPQKLMVLGLCIECLKFFAAKLSIAEGVPPDPLY